MRYPSDLECDQFLPLLLHEEIWNGTKNTTLSKYVTILTYALLYHCTTIDEEKLCFTTFTCSLAFAIENQRSFKIKIAVGYYNKNTSFFQYSRINSQLLAHMTEIKFHTSTHTFEGMFRGKVGFWKEGFDFLSFSLTFSS